MSEWDDFDRDKGKEARDEGMSKALRAERVAIWKADADAWLEARPSGLLFTLDDVTRSVGVPDLGANRNNVVGAWTSGKAKKGLIEWTGDMSSSKRVTRHVGLQRIWRVA